MSVYVDAIGPVVMNKNWRWPTACHMIADTEDELHDMALRLRLKHSWCQKKNNNIPHYDLTENKRKQAVKLGCIEIGLQEMGKRIREYRLMRANFKNVEIKSIAQIIKEGKS